MQKEQTKKLVMDVITGLVVAGVLVVGYFAFKSNTATVSTVSSVIVSSPETADEAVIVGIQVKSTIDNLRELKTAVEKSSAVFSAPAFASLQDFSVAVTPEGVGRINPFIPTDWKLSQKSR